MSILPLGIDRQLSDDDRMFSVHCPRHGTQVLLSERRIEGIDTVEDGLVVRWRCRCGQPGRFHTGRPRVRPDIPA